MEPEERIKRLGIQRGAHQVGIASVADINRFAPPGHRPDDFLIGAKSVVVFAGHTTLRSAWHSPDYRVHYSNRDFPHTRSGVALSVAKFIENEFGCFSISGMPPSTGFNPSLSLKLCAELAGLGTRSMAGGIILNHELGMMNLSVCLTTMPLTADEPMQEPVCPHPSCIRLWERRKTTPCLDTCPECLSGELDQGRIKWMRYDRRICSTRAQNLSVGAFLSIFNEGIKQPDPDLKRSLLLGSFTRNAVEAIASGAVVGQCGECLRHCPICVEVRNLKPKAPKPDARSI